MADDTAMTHSQAPDRRNEAAPGVEKLDVKAVNTAEDASFSPHARRSTPSSRMASSAASSGP